VIDADLIVAVPSENSDISANAIAGNGGRVDITTQGIFGLTEQPALTSASDITASSASGIAGIVDINTVAVDPNQGLVNLPEAIATPKLAQGCQPGSPKVASQFINSGRGGLRPHPFEARSSSPVIGDVRWPRQLQAQRSRLSVAHPPAVQEAQGWQRDTAGQIRLVSALPAGQTASVCQAQVGSEQALRY
jgi:large exoprotein involved in heme utilization and adhesion